MDFYKHVKVRDNIFKITDIAGVNMYLVCGEEKAILIDTGNGIEGLYDYVKGLTNLPLEVVLTHGHVDHCGGARSFETVYLNEKDWKLADVHGEIPMRKGYVDSCIRSLKEVDTETVPYVSKRKEPYQPIIENQVWRLGGISVKAVPLYGHTYGMTAMLIPEERVLIAGDGCNQFTLIVDGLSIEEYKENLLHIKEIESEYDIIWLSHGPEDVVPKEIVDNNIEICNDIMQGRADDVPVKFLDLDAFLAKKCVEGEGFVRVDNKVGNIAYLKEHIWKNS